MLTGHIDNCAFLDRLPERLKKGFELIRSGRFDNEKPGRYEIEENGDMFVLVNEYDTMDTDKTMPETHRVYGEIQYIAAGGEKMGWAPVGRPGQVVGKPYNPADDCEFYAECADEAFLTIQPGMFAIFMPEDIHRPKTCLVAGKPAPVRKYLVKIRADLLQ